MIPTALLAADAAAALDPIAAGASVPAPPAPVSADAFLTAAETKALADGVRELLSKSPACPGVNLGAALDAVMLCSADAADFEDASIRRVAWCIVVTLCPSLGEGDPEADTLAEDLAAVLLAGTTRFRGPGAPKRPNPTRTGWRRAPKGRIPYGPIYCNGEYRGRVPLYWSYAQLLAWARKNCFERQRRGGKKGGGVGGTLAEGRRAPGLFDFRHPIDEDVKPGAYDPRTGRHTLTDGWTPPFQPGDTGLPPGWTKWTAPTVQEWGTTGKFGIKCEDPGSSLTCVNHATGSETIWTVTGRKFSAPEKDTFVNNHCKDACGGNPASMGAPPDARVKRIRAQPANPAVRDALKCGRPGAERPARPWAWRPLPDIPGTPLAAVPPPACKPDTILGRDCGYFGSGWWIIAPRGGGPGIELVAAPNTCGGPLPAIPCAPSPF